MPASKLMGAFRVVIRRERHGGAGGIRTHEWRFCRPLPWATWVPRRTFEYSKSSKAIRTTRARGWGTRPLFFFHGRGHRDLGLAQEAGRLLRRCGIDVKACAPFKACDFCQ